MPQPGPIFDNAMKGMFGAVPAALCRWMRVDIEGEVSTIPLSELASPAVTRQVDALVAIGEGVVVHIEFQSSGEARFAMRMLDYRLRLYRRAEVRGRRLVQHVVMLGDGTVEDGLQEDGLDYRYAVHYLRDQPVEPLLSEPALAPLATLAKVPDRERPLVLRRAIDLIASVTDPELRTVLADAAADLATVRLGPDIIQSTWEDSEMPVPSFANLRYETGRSEGREEGREAMISAMLNHRFGPDARIPSVARALAALEPDDYLDRFEKADRLDDLTAPA
jgi:hypothetical protein